MADQMAVPQLELKRGMAEALLHPWPADGLPLLHGLKPRGLWTLWGRPPPPPLPAPAALSVTPGSWQREQQVENTKGFLRLER